MKILSSTESELQSIDLQRIQLLIPETSKKNGTPRVLGYEDQK
jgi:hypothetical protein